MSDGINCLITGREIHEWIMFPEVPRKGDVLWLSSLTRGRVHVLEGVVSKVEWAMEQTTDYVHPWVTVRRTKEYPPEAGDKAEAPE